MFDESRNILTAELDAIRAAGLYKVERVIQSPQAARIVVNGRNVLNLCANNYLGLSGSRKLISAAQKGLENYGLGLASVRFICGTQTIHRDFEKEIAEFLGTDDAILYTSCFDANGGLFETLCSEQDAVISDSLNHASIIDGIRLSRAARFKYRNSDMDDLERCLKEARENGARQILIATDGVFSMDGSIADLKGVCDLADRYRAMVMVDDSHATGFMGKKGRGTPEHCGVQGRIDMINSTLGKALGGAAGGFTAGRQEIIDLLRQRSRPYLFSNSLPPALAASGREALRILSDSTELRDRLEKNALRFRSEIAGAGFSVKPGEHPIVPIMLEDAALAVRMADAMLEEGIYVVGFSFPVVPKGEARIRVQLSADHSYDNIDEAVAAFHKVGRALGILT